MIICSVVICNNVSKEVNASIFRIENVGTVFSCETSASIYNTNLDILENKNVTFSH